MATGEISKVGKRGTIVIPVSLRRRFGLEEGSYVLIEERDEGLLLRGAVLSSVEIYSPERQAEFILSNTVDREDYEAALAEVREMGLDPADIPHVKPPGM